MRKCPKCDTLFYQPYLSCKNVKFDICLHGLLEDESHLGHFVSNVLKFYFSIKQRSVMSDPNDAVVMNTRPVFGGGEARLHSCRSASPSTEHPHIPKIALQSQNDFFLNPSIKSTLEHFMLTFWMLLQFRKYHFRCAIQSNRVLYKNLAADAIKLNFSFMIKVQLLVSTFVQVSTKYYKLLP
jgi:hypothetical protein